MRYHLDTSFLIDWQGDVPEARVLAQEISNGTHEISIDGVAYTEFMAVSVVQPRKRIVIGTVLRLGQWHDVSLAAARLATQWIASMDVAQRRAFFADALISAVAHSNGAVLLTSDDTAARTFPVATNVYR